MTIHFFVGSEFSNCTNFKALSDGSKKLSGQEDMVFYPCSGNNLNAITDKFQDGDVIIGASAGGSQAAALVQELDKKGKKRPLILGFEPYGLKKTEGVKTFVQADDPKGIIKEHQALHDVYQFKDDHGVEIGGKKRYVFGHAFYSIHPAFIKSIQFDRSKVQLIDNSEYILIPSATLEVGGKKYNYSNIVAKKDGKDPSILDATNSGRVFDLGLIYGIVQSCKNNTLGNKFTQVTPAARVPTHLSVNKKPSIVTKKADHHQDHGHEDPSDHSVINQQMLSAIEELKKLTEDYKQHVSKREANKKQVISPVIDKLSDIVNTQEDPKKVLYDYFSFLNQANQVSKPAGGTTEPEYKNIDIIKQDKSRSARHFCMGIALILATLVTGVLPGMLVMSIFCAITKWTPIDLFKSNGERFEKKSNTIKNNSSFMLWSHMNEDTKKSFKKPPESEGGVQLISDTSGDTDSPQLS
jgi:hypothetical protein